MERSEYASTEAYTLKNYYQIRILTKMQFAQTLMRQINGAMLQIDCKNNEELDILIGNEKDQLYGVLSDLYTDLEPKFRHRKGDYIGDLRQFGRYVFGGKNPKTLTLHQLNLYLKHMRYFIEDIGLSKIEYNKPANFEEMLADETTDG